MRVAMLAILGALTLTGAATARQAAPATSASEMLAEARELAAGEPDLIAEIEAAQAAASKGVLDNKTAIAVRRTIPGGASWSTAMARRAGEPLVIAVRRIGDAPVTLRVADAAGTQLCEDATVGAMLTCRIAPGAGALSVRVSNPGAGPAEAMLLTN